MPTIRRLADSCLVVADDQGATLIDPGFFTYESGEVDLGTIGDIQRVLITHEHGDHVHPAFVRWLLDRGSDVRVYCNDAVAALLAQQDIEASTADPQGVTSEDVVHEMVPTGATPPNRSYSVGGVLTHPGDSYQPTSTAPVMALPLIAPWGSATASVEFARRMAPRQVIPIHDHYLTAAGRSWITSLVKQVLAADDIELVSLDWGDGYSV